MDNAVDMAHFYYVHYAIPRKFKVVLSGKRLEQHFEGVPRDDMFPERLNTEKPQILYSESVSSFDGPAVLISEMIYHFEGFDVNLRGVNFYYPIDTNSFRMIYGTIVQHTESISGRMAQSIANHFADVVTLGFEQDIKIWSSKRWVEKPLLCDADGPIYQLRDWYQQFYEAPGSRPPFDEVFELDTSNAVLHWTAESGARA